MTKLYREKLKRLYRIRPGREDSEMVAMFLACEMEQVEVLDESEWCEQCQYLAEAHTCVCDGGPRKPTRVAIVKLEDEQ